MLGKRAEGDWPVDSIDVRDVDGDVCGGRRCRSDAFCGGGICGDVTNLMWSGAPEPLGIGITKFGDGCMIWCGGVADGDADDFGTRD